MPSPTFDRHHDDELKIRLRSRATQERNHTPRIGGSRLRLSRAGRPQAVGLYLPRPTHTTSGSSGGHGVGIVKAKYVSSARAGGLTRYLEKDVPEQMSAYVGRDGAGHEGHKAELFNEHGPVSDHERQAFVSRAQRDPRLWHVIVSPPFAEQLDMPRFVQSFMQQMQADTGLKLDYIASIHRDTEHVHSHLLVRGRACGGSEYRFERDYLSHSMRIRAEEIAQRQLALGLDREPAMEQVVEVAHSRTVPQQEAHQRLQETIATSRQGPQTARDTDHGWGY